MATNGLRRNNFLLTGKTRTEEQVNSENKVNKEKKKEYRAVLKSNKDVIEEITKSSTESTTQMEDQLSRMGKEIKDSNTSLQKTMIGIAQTLKELPKTSPHRPTMRKKWILRPTTKSAKHQTPADKKQRKGRTYAHKKTWRKPRMDRKKKTAQVSLSQMDRGPNSCDPTNRKNSPKIPEQE